MQFLSEILSKSNDRYPDRIAVEAPGKIAVSYADLALKCEQLKKKLQSFGIGKGDRIGILMPKSIESVVAILGSLTTNAAYIPVDSNAPLYRNSFIFTDCQVKAILIDSSKTADFIEALPAEVEVQTFEDFSFDLLICAYQNESAIEVPDDLAYILYTSGSTGQPKGVMVTHNNAISFIEWCARHFDLSEKDIFTSIAPFHFDLSIFDLYVSLLKGGKLVLIDQEASKNPMLLAQFLEEYQVTTIYATPTLLKLILRYGKPQRYNHKGLRLVLFAGEVFSIPPLTELKKHWPTAGFYNLYGPTETNVVTWFELPNQIPVDRNKPFPIGQSCPHVRCEIWDNGIQIPTAGLRGELVVSGASVTQGYLNLPVKTASSFVEEGGVSWYKTGDVVELNKALEFVFVGRKDRMIKRRGYRIELGEIETQLARHSEITDSGVVAIEKNVGEWHVIAFIQKHSDAEPLATVELHKFCLKKLPAYMVPDQFVYVDNLPKTSTHKVDYQKLKERFQN